MSTKQADPRGEFKGRTDDDLRRERGDLTRKQESLRRKLNDARPLREDVESHIAEAQAIATERIQRLAKSGLWDTRNGGIGIGLRDPENLAISVVIASDAFKQAAIEHYAAGRPTEAELAPHREELARVGRRRQAIDAELGLRELDRQRAAEEAKREAALERLKESSAA
jgi:hypothetical protein